MSAIRRLPESELDIMLAVWDAAGPITAPELHQALARPLTASALHSYLKRLEEKGFLRREKAGKTNRYIPLVTRQDYQAYDLLLGMDRANLRNMERLFGGDPAGNLGLLLDYTDAPGEVADPWYTGDFDAAWRDISRGCQGLLSALQGELAR